MELDCNRSDDQKFYDLERAITNLEDIVRDQTERIDQLEETVERLVVFTGREDLFRK